MATNHPPAVRNSNVDLRKRAPRSERIQVDGSMPDVCRDIYPGSADLLDGFLSFLARSCVYVGLRAINAGRLERPFCIQFNNRIVEYDGAT